MYTSNPVTLNRSKLSPKIIAILDKFKLDKNANATLKHALKLSTHKIMQDSMTHNSFCDYFAVSKKLPGLLVKIYGITERELEHEMHQFNLKDYSVYTKSYYTTLLLSYLIGLDNNDKELREYSLALISILIWNYYKLKYFPTVCDPEIARYVVNYELQANHTFKKYGSPFGYIMKHSIPGLEAKYPREIAADPTAEFAGIRRILTTIRSRYNQLMKGIGVAYYDAYSKGKKESVAGSHQSSYADSKEQTETREHFSGVIERVTDKIMKNGSLRTKVLSKDPIKKFLYGKFFLSNSVISKIDDYLDADKEDLKYYIELLLSGLKLKSEEELCGLNLEVLANRITSSKKDEYFKKLKELNEGITTQIFGTDVNKNIQNKYRYNKITIVSILSYIKFMSCRSI